MSGILDTRHLDQRMETTFEQNVAAADPKFVKYPAGTYNVSNPHPGFGVDPNIINEFGHTMYPKWVKNTSGQDVVVNSSKEEAEVTGTAKLRDDGPTIQQYVEAGYKASGYPPEGYKPKSTPEEVQEYIDKEKSAPHPWDLGVK